MEKHKICSVFGHSTIDITKELENKLRQLNIEFKTELSRKIF